MRNITGSFLRSHGAILTMVLATVLACSIPVVSAGPPTEKKCDDGKDNDGDGKIDAADEDCSDDSGGGNTGNGQDTPVDVYLFHDSSYGIRGDEWADGDPGDPNLNPGGLATFYPANATLSGEYSCAHAIVTDQAQGSVRLFVPAGDGSSCPAVNRFVRIRSDYDLDQDGLCNIPYTGRVNARGFELDYGCVAPEPDGDVEETFVTADLYEVMVSDTTPAGFQIRLVEYYDGYVPTPGVDPGLADVKSVGSQARAYVISLTDGTTTSMPDPADPDGEVRIFENSVGTATMCQVNWKNAKAKNCDPVLDEFGDPVVVVNMTMKGKVDPSPLTATGP